MRKSAVITAVLILLSLGVFAGAVRAQEAKTSESKPSETKPQPEIHYYRLEFVLKELSEDGRVVNSRIYHTSVSTQPGRSSQVRTGTKIPVRTNEKNGNIEFMDVGVSIDCDNARETPQGVSLHISSDVSSLANPPGSGENAAPVLRQNRWSSETLVPLGKPTVVFSSDNLENKGRMQVEVTATPIR